MGTQFLGVVNPSRIRITASLQTGSYGVYAYHEGKIETS